MSVFLPATSRNPADYPEELRHAAAGADRACRLCGQRRGRSDADELWVEDGPFNPNGPVRAVRNDDGIVVDELQPQPWRWRHLACELTAATVVAGVLGVHVTEDVARKALAEAEVSTARNSNIVSRKPWGHLTAQQRNALRFELGIALAVTVPMQHVEGRCVICGRSRSSQWWETGVTWPDGSGAQCGDCTQALEALDPFDLQGRRHAAVCLLAGLHRALGRRDDYGLKYAAEVIPDEHRHDDEQAPWSYSPAALGAVKRTARRVEAENVVDPLQRAATLKINAVKRARALADQTAADAAEDGVEPVRW